MFGAICLGRPMVLAQQVDTTKYVISVPNASKINYITIFILPNSPFVDNNLTALVYFQLPTPQQQQRQQQQQQHQQQQQQPEFKLLGGINPAKPSAIYRLSNFSSGAGNGNGSGTGFGGSSTGDSTIENDQGMEVDNTFNGQGSGIGGASGTDANDQVTINIGISIEPTVQAEQILQQSKADNSGGLVHTRASTTTTTTARANGEIPAIKDPQSTATLANKIVGHAYNYLASFIDPQGKVPIKAFDNWWEKFKTKLQTNPNFLNELQE